MAERSSTGPRDTRNGGVPGARAMPAGARVSPLDALVDGTRIIRAGDLVREARPPEFVVDQVLTAGSVIILAGDAKLAKKTWTAMELGLRTARGEPFLGFPTHRRRVIYMFMEDGRRRVAWRLKQIGVPEGDAVAFQCAVERGVYAEVVSAMEAALEPVLLIIDPFVRFGLEVGLEDENNAAEVERVLAPLRDLAQETNSTVLIIHHFRKARDTMRGSVALEGSSDGWIKVRPLPNGDTVLEWTLRDAEVGEAGIHFSFTGSSVSLEPAAVSCSAEQMTTGQKDIEALREFMRTHTERRWSQMKISNAIFGGGEAGRNRARAALSVLEENGEVRRPDGPKAGYEPTPKLLEDALELD